LTTLDQAPTRAGHDGDALEISVLTFNIRHGEGADNVLDLERIRTVIDLCDADVIALQEVDRHFGPRSGWEDQAAALSRMTGYHVVYGANVDEEPPAPLKPRIQFGTAVLSRHRILEWGNTRLYCSPGEEQRGLLHAVIDVRGIRVNVYNTHLDAFSEIDRREQARQIVQLIGETEPAVLLGDFNAESHSPDIAMLGARFIDAWRAYGEGQTLTYPVVSPAVRIDHIFTSVGVEAVHTAVVTDHPLASDHFPVLSRILVRARSVDVRHQARAEITADS
jgi:endonuclease/exonuclease/phosphatase family metal-dependent hydrolase